MGKTNKAPRTKGNTRPSSSGHSAELLSGKALSGFIGFDALEKDTLSYVPVTGQHVTDATDSTVDSDFRMVMRKMLKRDPVTRLKAVQEFGEHCDEKDKDVVKNVLPYWPRLFNKLALDSDRRIREATHQANGKLVLKVKRDVAPYLKNIMGVWMLGQCDLYAPASSAAQTTFTATFPPNKQTEALMFCKAEIFAYFKDNLFEQTAKSMSEPNPTSAEDVENKYTLVISATFQALKLILTTMLPSERANIQDEFSSIVAENKFWKFAKCKEAQVRGAWYALISSLCQFLPNIFAEMKNKLATTVFTNLSESEPVVAPSVWEAALHIVVSFENCWQGIDIHKVVLPQLWLLLKGGGKGNAHVLYPCLLPFLSKLPKSVMEKETFLMQFFSYLKDSLVLELVKVSPMECDAILMAFIECLQYICCVRLGSVEAGPVLLEKVMLDHLLPVVKSSLDDTGSAHLSSSQLYPLIGSLIQKIEQKCDSEDKELSEAFLKILTLFWEQISIISATIFLKKQKEKVELSLYLSYFYHSVFIPSKNLFKREKSRVRFEDECDSTGEGPESSKSTTPDKLTNVGASLSNKMPHSCHHAINFCKQLCEKIDEDCDICYLKLLNEILLAVLNEESFKKLLELFSVQSRDGLKAPVVFCKNTILSWLSAVNRDAEKISCIVDIIFYICCLSKEDALQVLNLCCEAKNPVLLEKLLSQRLNFEQWCDIKLKNSDLSQTIMNGLKEMCDVLLKEGSGNTTPEDLKVQGNVLFLCLTSKDFTEPLMDAQNVETVLHIVKEFSEETLKVNSNSEYASNNVEFACDTLAIILKECKVCWNFSVTDDLISLLFQMNMNSLRFHLTEKASQTLLKTLQLALDSSVQVRSDLLNDGNFIVRAALDLHSSLLCLENNEEAERLSDHCSTLLSAVERALLTHKSNVSESCYTLGVILDIILPTGEDWNNLKEGHNMSLLPSFLEKKLFYPLPAENSLSFSKENDQLIRAAEVISNIFSNQVNRSCGCDDDDEIYLQQQLITRLPLLLWSLGLYKTNLYFYEGDKESKSGTLERNCVELMSFLPYEEVCALKNKIFHFCLINGTSWAIPFDCLLEIVSTVYPENTAKYSTMMIKKANMSDSVHKHIVSQILIRHISAEEKMYLVNLTLTYMCDTWEVVSEEPDNNVAGKLAQICCCLQDREVVFRNLCNILMGAVKYIIKIDFGNKEKLLRHLQVITFLSAVAQREPSALKPELWDYYITLLSSLLKESRLTVFKEPKDLLLLQQAVTIFSTLSLFLQMNDEQQKKLVPPQILAMSDDIYEDFVSLFIYVADICGKVKPISKMFEIVLTSLLQAVEYISGEQLVKILMPHDPNKKNITAESKTKSIGFDWNSFISSLMSNNRQLQFASHSMLLKIMPLLPNMLTNDHNDDDDEDSESDVVKVPVKLSPLIDLLTYTNEVVESMLLEVRIGDCCTVLPCTDSYVFAIAYLFAWIEMLEFVSSSPSQIRSGYAAHLEETKLLSSMLSNVFRLMPDNPKICLKGPVATTPKKESLKLLFVRPPMLTSGVPSSEEIQTLACYTFATALRKVPASVRTWWNNLDKKSADIVNKFTSKYISGILCIEEIQAVHDNEAQFENMVVRARPGSREVIATYTIDDCAIELCVQLPSNYPLGPISAERRGKIVIAQQEWRHWLMQLATVLTYQNGSILDGLNIWKKNLDKKFEGVEECMICYYILHSSTLKLPKLSCHVCRKKFHSACLYKWFHTSNNFTCPLCRNEFGL